jgi:hypothetical protein
MRRIWNRHSMWPTILVVILGFAFVQSMARAQTPSSQAEETTAKGKKKSKKQAATETKEAATTAASEAKQAGSATAAEKASTTATKAKAGAQEVPFTPPPSKGMVWVNLNSKVYHVEGDRYYGETKNGKYMTPEDAKKAGYREAKAGGKPKN